jgi:hypothetical protein
MAINMSLDKEDDQLEFVTSVELDHLGGVVIYLNHLVNIWPGDYVQPINKAQMFMVEHVEQVEDLFENWTMVRTSLVFANQGSMLPVALNDFFPGYAIIREGMQRKQQRLLWYGNGSNPPLKDIGILPYISGTK